MILKRLGNFVLNYWNTSKKNHSIQWRILDKSEIGSLDASILKHLKTTRRTKSR